MFRPGNLGHIGRLGLMSASQATLLQQAIAAIRRNNGALFYVPQNFAGAWTDSAGTDPVDAVADVIGRMTDSTGGSAVATQATTANKPTVQTNAQGWNVMRFDGSNDFLQTGIATGNEGWICAGLTPENTTTAMTIANAGEGAATIPGVWLFSSGGGILRASAATGTLRHQATAAMAGTQPQVVSMGWNASGIFAGVNATESATMARTGDCSSGANVLRIGMYQDSSIPFNGEMAAQVICPVLPSAADRAIIRKWIGSLQGQSL